MTNDKRFEGIWNATAEKRYKHFVTYTVDYESVWLLSDEDGYATIDVDGYIEAYGENFEKYLMSPSVYPQKQC